MVDSTASLFAPPDAPSPDAPEDDASSCSAPRPASPESERPASSESDGPASPCGAAFGSEAAGHSAFVNRLYERHKPTLLRYLLGLLRRRADAEDVLQETYARLLSGAPLDRDDARCRAYVFKIATNLAHDRYRRRAELSLEDRPPDDEPSNPADVPDLIVDFAQAFAIVKKTLLELKPRCRQVFLLRVSEELPYETIAERLGVGKRTVEREMQHALEVLQKRLKRSRK